VERRSLGGLSVLVSPLLEREGFLAAFTERDGGGSAAPYDTLNLGLYTRDRRATVLENRGRVIRALGVPPWAMAFQVHGADVVRIGRDRAGAGFDDGAPVRGFDALAVSDPGVPVAVLTADCLPIALASPTEGLVVAVHAGWRGLSAGVVQRATSLFADGPTLAAIGPGIRRCHYEVGVDVAEAVDRGTGGTAAVDRRDGRTFLDLSDTAQAALRALGVERIDAASECTACEEGRFFSARRDGPTGRQAMVAMRL